MPTIDPFERHTDRYDRWFESHRAAFESELAAVRSLLPGDESVSAVEIGVGSGQFAAPLDVDLGVDPSPAMLARARDRGIVPVRGVAEALPLRADSVAVALLVTTVCFVDDLDAALAEARRVLRPDGRLVIGFVDRDSRLGEQYQEKQSSNPFYRDATFLGVGELRDALLAAGFGDLTFAQTLFTDPTELDGTDRVESGWGNGSFVVVAATPS
ncbi:class I SAM-dependent methyltransferase [Halorientalis brevis]|uniref:Class I SAM-dependent methyltransferase n=1 Tax=Halorientalis brevis TaxID=1126241 RepID=A0ABD6C7L9_9EURY|nr:class I SAM-dependent methyltransferase [Halorientalis brevis]